VDAAPSEASPVFITPLNECAHCLLDIVTHAHSVRLDPDCDYFACGIKAILQQGGGDWCSPVEMIGWCRSARKNFITDRVTRLRLTYMGRWVLTSWLTHMPARNVFAPF